MLTLLLASAVVVTSLIYVALDYRSRKRIEDEISHGGLPPQPAGSVPLIGSFTSFIKLTSEEAGKPVGSLDWLKFWQWRRLPVAKVFANWAAEYGPVFSTDVFGRRFVVLNDYETIRQALTHPKGAFNYRPRDRQFFILGRRGLLAAEGPTQQKNRRFVLRAFRDLGVGKAAATDVIKVECAELSDYLHETKGLPIDTRNCIAKAVFNVTSNFISGHRFDWDDDELIDLADCSDSTTDLEAAGLYNFVPPLLVPMLYALQPIYALKDLKTVFGYARKAIKRRRDALVSQMNKTASLSKPPDSSDAAVSVGDVEPTEESLESINAEDDGFEEPPDEDAVVPRNVIDFYLLAAAGKLQLDGGQVFDYEGELLPSVRDMFIAGLETTTTALRWACLLLATHREVQDRMQAELDQFVRQHRYVDPDAGQELGPDQLMPKYEEREFLPYTEAVILEVLRWSSGVPILPHATQKLNGGFFGFLGGQKPIHGAKGAAEIGGFKIPPGTPVYLNVYAAHRDKKVWPDSPNLSAFDPHHFLDQEHNVVINRDKLFTFAMGKRSCIGEGLAKQELFCFMTTVVQHFDIRLPDGIPAPDMCGKYGMTWAPLEHKLRFLPRNFIRRLCVEE